MKILAMLLLLAAPAFAGHFGGDTYSHAPTAAVYIPAGTTLRRFTVIVKAKGSYIDQRYYESTQTVPTPARTFLVQVYGGTTVSQCQVTLACDAPIGTVADCTPTNPGRAAGETVVLNAAPYYGTCGINPLLNVQVAY